MPRPPAGDLIGLVTQRTASDWMLGGFGFSVAAASASFALYMVAIGPGNLKPFDSDQTTAVVPWNRPPGALAAQDIAEGPSSVMPTAAVMRQVRRAASNLTDVDFAPTGSIGALEPKRGTASTAAISQASKPADLVSKPLDSVLVRDVFDGKAVVEVRNKLQIVQPGSVLDGIGEVLSIRRDGQHWVVQTSGGAFEN